MRKAFVLGFLLGFICVPVFVYAYFRLGYAPVATAGSAMPFERLLVRSALHATLKNAENDKAPVDASEPNLVLGVKTYREDCAVCHGLPGQGKTEFARGMYPAPPELFRGKGVTDDSVGETHWKVANGIRLTGMPAFRGSLSEDQMWAVSQLLAHANELPEAVSRILREPDAVRVRGLESKPATAR